MNSQRALSLHFFTIAFLKDFIMWAEQRCSTVNLGVGSGLPVAISKALIRYEMMESLLKAKRTVDESPTEVCFHLFDFPFGGVGQLSFELH